jgi:hypothetical protein
MMSGVARAAGRQRALIETTPAKRDFLEGF